MNILGIIYITPFPDFSARVSGYPRRGQMKILTALLMLVAASVCWGQTVPAEVKQAIAISVKASNSPTADDPQGGHHEEGGMWGLDKAGNVIVLVARPGKSTADKCGVVTSIGLGDSDSPRKNDLVSILGEWHVHPAGISQDGNVLCNYVQPPSAVDKAGAITDTSIVIGARDKIVYFYNSKGVTSTVKLKDFLK